MKKFTALLLLLLLPMMLLGCSKSKTEVAEDLMSEGADKLEEMVEKLEKASEKGTDAMDAEMEKFKKENDAWKKEFEEKISDAEDDHEGIKDMMNDSKEEGWSDEMKAQKKRMEDVMAKIMGIAFKAASKESK